MTRLQTPGRLCPSFCGDAVVDAGEACDQGANNSDTEPDACSTACATATCGDGVVDSGEECDNSGVADGCGCSSTDGGFTPPYEGLMLLAFFVFTRRRRRQG